MDVGDELGVDDIRGNGRQRECETTVRRSHDLLQQTAKTRPQSPRHSNYQTQIATVANYRRRTLFTSFILSFSLSIYTLVLLA